MALNFLLKRSGTADKRPDPTSMAQGELDLNYDAETGGVFYKDSNGDVVKVGSAQVSATAPNATPVGSAGNSTGEFWYDTANSSLKMWDGTAWIETGGGGGGGGTVTEITAGTGLTGGTITTTGTIALDSACVIAPSLLAAKGSLISASAASTPTELSVGTNGQVLYACSTAASGLCWAAAPTPSTATPTVAGVVYGCNITTGPFFNTAFGFCANLGNGGGLNTAIGHQAMTATTSGTNNTAVGHQAACALTSGVCNVMVGALAGRSVTTGVGVTAVGRIAICAATGSCNTALGNNVGNLLTTGANNTLLGACAGCNLTTGSNNVAIGFNTTVTSATGSCQLSIGFSPTDNWLTGTSTKAIKPGAGIIDCTGSCGTAGQVLMSDGANAVCWGTAGGGGGSGTVTDITAGAGLTGGTITTSGTIAIDSACVLEPADFTAKGQILVGTGSGTYCALPVGSNGQVLYANSFYGSGVYWGAAPAASTTETLGLTYGCVEGPAPFPNLSCDNASFGYSSMGCNLAGGEANVAVGNNSAYWMSTGSFNTAVGNTALFATTAATESNNTAVGYGAMANAGGSRNVAVGQNAGYCTGCNNTGGDDNVVIGFNAACLLETGSQNVVIGSGVQPASVTGSCQLAIGFADGQCWLSGTSTKAIRPGAGIIDCAGSCGTAGQVLMSNGANAICWGAAGGASPATPIVAGVVLGCTATTAAKGTTSLGSGALTGITTAFYATVVGADAGAAVTTGNYNTLLGFCAGNKITTGGSNTAVGGLALRNATTTNNNTAIGYNTLGQTTGINNTALGTAAGTALTTGCFNTFLGGNAGASTTTGTANTVISPINAFGSAPVFNVTTENNRFVAGHTGITNAYVQVAWTVVSDARDKIVEGTVPHGLEFVKQLEPKAFHFKETRESTDPHGPLRYGFLAQDILALEGSDSVIIDAEDPEKLRYNGEALVPVLVNAIKELSARNEALEARIAALEAN